MKHLRTAFAAILVAGLATAALAGTFAGAVTAVDPKTSTLSAADPSGKVWTFAWTPNTVWTLDGPKPSPSGPTQVAQGDKVTVTFDTDKAGKNTASAVLITKPSKP